MTPRRQSLLGLASFLIAGATIGLDAIFLGAVALAAGVAADWREAFVSGAARFLCVNVLVAPVCLTGLIIAFAAFAAFAFFAAFAPSPRLRLRLRRASPRLRRASPPSPRSPRAFAAFF